MQYGYEYMIQRDDGTRGNIYEEHLLPGASLIVRAKVAKGPGDVPIIIEAQRESSGELRISVVSDAPSEKDQREHIEEDVRRILLKVQSRSVSWTSDR